MNDSLNIFFQRHLDNVVQSIFATIGYVFFPSRHLIGC